jgi:hypothetical protein
MMRIAVKLGSFFALFATIFLSACGPDAPPESGWQPPADAPRRPPVMSQQEAEEARAKWRAAQDRKRAEAWQRAEEKQRRREADDDARIEAEDPATRAEREKRAAETQRQLDNVIEHQNNAGDPDDPTD